MDIFALLAGSLCTLSLIPQLVCAQRGIFQISKVFLIMYLVGVINWGLFGFTLTPINYPLLSISVLQAIFTFLILVKLVKRHG
jgi:uncharacterized protein with PQ loop repeat